MQVERISGGIEYRPEVMTLVLPGDRDYRVRTTRVSTETTAPAAQTNRKIAAGGSALGFMDISSRNSSLDSQKALSLLRYLGDLEAEGTQSNYTIMDIRDEYVGMKGRVIDIWI